MFAWELCTQLYSDLARIQVVSYILIFGMLAVFVLGASLIVSS